MAGVVKFTLDAEDQKAVSAFMRVVDAQKKTERELKKISKAGKQTTSTMGGLGKSIMGLTGGLIGAAGLKMAFGAMSRSIEEISGKTVQFEDELTGLLSLGQNVENIAAIKNEVLAMAGAFGISRKLITDTLFDLQSGASALSKDIRDDLMRSTIELNKVTGVDLPIGMKALLKTFLIYRDELKDVDNAQSKLFKTAELGFLTFQDMAVYLPDVLAPAKALGFSFDEIAAALITATQYGGRTEKTFTGLRNVVIRMDKAMEEGIVSHGTLLEQLKELSAQDPKLVAKIFGAETIAVISSLVAHVGEYKTSMDAVADVQRGLATEKYLTRLKDESFRYSEIAKSIKEMNSGLILSEQYIKTTGKVTQQIGLTEIGIKKAMGPWGGLFGGVAKPLAWTMALMSQIEEAEFGQRRFKEGPQLPRFSGEFLERGRKEFLRVQERAGAEGTVLGRQQRERWGMGPATATGAGEGTDKLDIAADKLDKAADKIITASETTDKAMSNISRGITSRN